jgi:hypothetical protein
MQIEIARLAEIKPQVIRRACGGWLAATPHNAGLSMGVTAPTEDEARETFGYVLARWLEIIFDPSN